MKTITSILDQRSTISKFDPNYSLSKETLNELIRLATQAPSAFNLQNWTFVAACSKEAKESLAKLAYGQKQVSEASVSIIVCGELNAHQKLRDRLKPSVVNGILPEAISEAWVGMATESHQDNEQLQRDEAIRSASLATMALILAAREMGLDSGVVGGFDPEGVVRKFQLGPELIPVMIVTLGQAKEGNWTQKIRRPVSEVLSWR